MDNSFHRQESKTQQPGGLLAGLQIFESILKWLAGLIKLTEEEQKDAGIYIKDHRYK
ncbi:MAG TPA: hypothetical protein VLE49_07135 [Anaerolineales bacterium]|nr:hypothetical protein [Anaerolineales bacterium]